MLSKGCCLLRPVKQHQQAILHCRAAVKVRQAGQSRFSLTAKAIRGSCVWFLLKSQRFLTTVNDLHDTNPITEVKSHSRLCVSAITNCAHNNKWMC